MRLPSVTRRQLVATPSALRRLASVFRHPPCRIVLLLGACAVASHASFGGEVSAPDGPALQFVAVMADHGGQRFRVVDHRSGAEEWIRLGEHGVIGTAVRYDARADVLTLRTAEGLRRLSLRGSAVLGGVDDDLSPEQLAALPPHGDYPPPVRHERDSSSGS